VVIRAQDIISPEKKHVAIKLLPRGSVIKLYKDYVVREIAHHSVLRHPFIIELKEVFVTPDYLAIVMDFAQGGNLHKFLRDRCENNRLGEDQARWLFQQLTLGLDFCHRNGVANRDLKLENLLLDMEPTSSNPLLRICDFGYSKHDASSFADTRLGTPAYMAPEVIFLKGEYSAKQADVWSLGVILYAMVCGHYPFNPQDPELPKRLSEGKVIYPKNVELTDECRDIIGGMLRPDVNVRLTLSQVLEHPWFVTDLPDGALTMNDWYLEHAPSKESREDAVMQLVELAAGDADLTTVTDAVTHYSFGAG
jgi:serine/threonine-protein kinase SRK2